MSAKKKIKLLCGCASASVKTGIAYLCGKLKYRNKHIWLVGERPWQAQDNGYHFFKFLRKNHPEHRAYYVIEKDSPHLEKVASLGEVVYYGTWKHWMMYFGCEAVISTHIRTLLPSKNWYYNKLAARFKQRKKKIVFLQHGIISADIPGLYRNNTRVDIFVCGAKPEYDFVSTSFHYNNDEVKYTGLARYDMLHDFKVKKQIMIMPTWRRWLMNDGVKLESTEYFREWNKVLSDKKLAEAVKKAGYKIVFYPHSNMQSSCDLFEPADDSIVIAGENEYDVQTLLKESALLITDFSSVFFDFAYMRKPVLFFHFDKERHAAEHYHKGYFDYERDGFGKVAYTAQDLIANTIEAIEEGAVLNDCYDKRIDRFFPLFDCNNCARIYDETVKLFTRKTKQK